SGLRPCDELGQHSRDGHQIWQRQWQRPDFDSVRQSGRQSVPDSRRLFGHDYGDDHLLITRGDVRSRLGVLFAPIGRAWAMLRKVSAAIVSALALGLTAGPAAAQAITVMPVVVDMQPGQLAATLSISGQGGSETSYQVRAFAGSQEGKTDPIEPAEH